MTERLGTELDPTDRAYVLSAYVYRHTGDHKPAGNVTYKRQFASDAEWLANTYFKVKKNGRLDRRAKFCRSNPTYPEGK